MTRTLSAARALGIADLIAPSWPAPRCVRALMTMRRGGVSKGPYGAGSEGGLNLGLGSGDARDAVLANRTRLRAFLPAEPAWLKQVHGAAVVDAAVVDAAAVDAAAVDAAQVKGAVDDAGVEADASFTVASGVVCAILVADCMPVLFCDRRGGRVAAAHAGWRGLAAGVLEATLDASGLEPRDTIAWIGPAIGPARFEVGSGVRDAYLAHDAASAAAFKPHRGAHGAASGPRDAGKWLADLPALARLRLNACGVNDVFDSGLCTASDALRFYSHRRDGVTGRMAALVWIDH